MLSMEVRQVDGIRNLQAELILHKKVLQESSEVPESHHAKTSQTFRLKERSVAAHHPQER